MAAVIGSSDYVVHVARMKIFLMSKGFQALTPSIDSKWRPSFQIGLLSIIPHRGHFSAFHDPVFFSVFVIFPSKMLAYLGIVLYFTYARH